LSSQLNQTLVNWEDVEKKFFTRFFPPSRIVGPKSIIATFSQGIDESLREA